MTAGKMAKPLNMKTYGLPMDPKLTWVREMAYVDLNIVGALDIV